MTTKPAAYYVELDRAYRSYPGPAGFILDRAMAKFGVLSKEIDADLVERFGASL